MTSIVDLKAKQRSRIFLEKHPERAAQYSKTYHERHPERSAQQSKAYRETHKEQIRARNKKRKRQRNMISPGYLRGLFATNSTLKSADIPQEIVELKKLHLLLKREIRKQRENTEPNQGSAV